MIKDCKVLINNDCVTVFDFDGVCIQIPSINKKADTVKVLFENGIYKVVDDNFKTDKEKDKRKKKTTNNETVMSHSIIKEEKVEVID